MVRGSCLCGGVRFEVDRLQGPFELCHCSRCRKTTGAVAAATIWLRSGEVRVVAGRELIGSYSAPILRSPPPYQTFFCRQCGSAVADPAPAGEWTEVPAGALDDDPGLCPDKHIFVDYNPAWLPIGDQLPQYTKEEIGRHRRSKPRTD
jgi:hypothetical protein